MIKLYILYFVFGFYMLFQSFFIWIFSAFSGGDTFITYLAMISSTILFAVASALSLHHVKLATILGIFALIGVFPFGMHWLLYRYEFEGPLIKGSENQIALLATAFYVLGVFYSIKYIINYKKAIGEVILRRPLKQFLTYMPPVLLLLFIIYVINP